MTSICLLGLTLVLNVHSQALWPNHTRAQNWPSEMLNAPPRSNHQRHASLSWNGHVMVRRELDNRADYSSNQHRSNLVIAPNKVIAPNEIPLTVEVDGKIHPMKSSLTTNEQKLQAHGGPGLQILCAVAVVLLFTQYGWSVRQTTEDLDSVSRRAVIAAYLSDVVLDLEYSVVMPTVYHLAMQYGSGAGFSGFVIGANQSFTVVGVLIVLTTGLGSASFRNVFLVVLGVYPLTSFLYVSSINSQSGILSCVLLVLARSLQGVLRGILECRVYKMFTEVVPKHELRSVSMCWALSIALGTGLGPIVSSVCLDSVAPLFPKHLRYVVPVGVMGVVHIMAFPLYYLLVPSSAALADCEADLRESQKDENAASRARSVVFPGLQRRVAALYFLIGACFVLSLLLGALESATSMILQTQYQWNNSSTGFVVGLCMLVYVPLHTVVEKFSSPDDQMGLLRTGLIVSFFMALLLLPGFCELFNDHFTLADTGTGWGCAVFIITSDAVVWPLTQMCVGIVTGMALELTAPDEEDSTSQLITIAVTITYFVSSPLARDLLDKQGVHSYALLQISLCLLAIALCEMSRFFRSRNLLPQAPSRQSLSVASSSSSPGGPPAHL